jgi:ubiquinone biosynthesis protein UbiJ
MTVRFASNPVPFAARTIQLPAGHVLTEAQVAQLVAFHTAKVADVAVVCADRPTLLAITHAFRAALRPTTGTVPTTPKAEVLHPVRSTIAPSLEAQLATAHATITEQAAALALALTQVGTLEADVVALQARIDQLEQEALATPKPKARRSRAKAAPAPTA